NFCVTNDGKVCASLYSRIRIIDKRLDLMIAREVLRQLLNVNPTTLGIRRGVKEFPSRVSVRLGQTRITIFKFLDEQFRLVARLIRIRRTVRHQISLKQVARRIHLVVAKEISPPSTVEQIVLKEAPKYDFRIRSQVRTGKQCTIVLRG